ncbi:MAG: hypothetical protein NWS33_04910 [Burkholderiaceae bacterium]|jgi:hypothetical protein|nr:hypothetical protein [Burkholderiaceae bacterium]MDP4862780.1 hypothetical protein [Burkholderiaceae bacterium]
MSDSSGFTAFVPGFDFIKNLGEQASTWGRAASAQPANGGAQAMSGMAAWVAPTFDVEELDKRINDLKSVQFWLEQNARALAATIQALEVQKMTLSTLKNMDMGLDDAVKAMQANPADLWRSWQTGAGTAKTASAAAPEPAPAQEATTQKAAPVDPMQWWGALSEQFQTIAQNAANEIAKASEQAEKMMATAAQPVAKKAGSAKKASSTTRASRAKAKPKATAAKKATARTRKPAA